MCKIDQLHNLFIAENQRYIFTHYLKRNTNVNYLHLFVFSIFTNQNIIDNYTHITSSNV